ncbi:MAG: hypothetical protein ABIZ91_17140 [Gemmatimonadaceae bacterium]
MITLRPRALLSVLFLLVLFVPRLRAQDTTYKEGVRIGLVYAPGTKPGLIVLPVAGATGDSVRAIIQRDLANGNRINVIAMAAEAVPPFGGLGAKPNYPLFAKLGAAAVLQLTPNSFGLEVSVHNTGKGVAERTKVFALAGAPQSGEWRLSLHEMSDEIEQWITGVRGVAASRILYTAGGRVWQVDSDGAGAVPLTASGTAMSPAWHPKASHFTYMMMGDNGQRIIIQEVGGATRTLATTPGGLNITPTFSPDGNTITYAHGAEAGTDIYSTNAFGNEPARRITIGRGSDNTQPSFSPDGRRIAFTSGRVGHPEVYISDADGTNAELLTPFNFGDQSYRANPDWSPDGRLIAFEALIGGRMQIMTISLRDRAIKQHTSEGVNEQPSWAPDARHLVFTSNRGGSRQLWVLDVESNTVRQLTRAPAGARFGAWSPLLRVR